MKLFDTNAKKQKELESLIQKLKRAENSANKEIELCNSIKKQIEVLQKQLKKQEEDNIDDNNMEQPQEADSHDANPEDLQKVIEEKNKELEECHSTIVKLSEQLKKISSEKLPLEEEPIELAENNNGFEVLLTELKDLKNKISDENMSLLKENESLRNKIDEKQERLEYIIQTSQEDRYRKDKIKLINKYIYHMDLIRKTLYDFDHGVLNDPSENPGQFWRSQLEALIKGMEATLLQEMVEVSVFGKPGDPVNPDYQETLDMIATDNPELDGKICSSVNPGYIWTLPYILKAKITDNGDEIKHYRFLLRPEQITVYKYNKQ